MNLRYLIFGALCLLSLFGLFKFLESGEIIVEDTQCYDKYGNEIQGVNCVSETPHIMHIIRSNPLYGTIAFFITMALCIGAFIFLVLGTLGG